MAIPELCVAMLMATSMRLGSSSHSSILPVLSMWQVRVNDVPNHRWGLQEKLSWGGSAPPDPPNLSAAVAASAGQEGPTVIALVGRCRGLRRPVFGVMSKISQDQHV